MSNLCVSEEVEIDWWIGEWKRSEGGGKREGGGNSECWRSGSMGRCMLRIVVEHFRKLCRSSWTRTTKAADNSQCRRCPPRLPLPGLSLLFLSDPYFPEPFFCFFFFFLSYPSHTHTQSRREIQALLNFLPQVKRWARTKWYLCSAVHICVGGATRPELDVSLR